MSTPSSSDDPDLETRLTGGSTPTTAGTAHAAVELGIRLGRYLPIEELGRGGMGTVLRAYDPKLEREVALKVMRGDAVDPLARIRMVREARTMAKLCHPNVVAVYDVDDDPQHGVMLAMELVKGATLQRWLRKSPRRWPEILSVFVEAGRGLSAAHAEGLLHRDFKPANVLIAHDGQGGRGPCKVTDFGLAKLEHEPPASTSGAPAPQAATSDGESGEALTQAGTVIGTPRYMAPEQHFGEALTSAADQFSYCVSLWEALYGEPPFAGETPTELVTNIDAGKPRSPATRAKAVPGWLRRVCERGLLAEPTQRWPSMNALIDALTKGRSRAGVRKGLAAVGVLALLGVGLEARRRWDLAARTTACEATGDEVEAAWSTEREQALRNALVGTGVSYAPTTADEVVPWLERQAVAWRQARVEACLDADVRGRWDQELLDRSRWCLEERHMELRSLVDELTRTDAEILSKAVRAAARLRSATACRDEAVLEELEPPPQQSREALGAVRADVIRAGNLELAGRYDEGLELAREVLERAETLGWPPLVAKTRLQLGSLLLKGGAYPEAEAELEKAYFEAAKGAVPGVAFDAATDLVDLVGMRMARPAEGRRWGQHAEAVLLDVPDGEQLRQATLLINLANIDHTSGAQDEAKQRFERALAILEQALGPEHPDVVGPLSNLGAVYATLGAYDEAKQRFERALAILEQALGPEHPDVAAALTNLAIVHESLGAYDEAKVIQERALALWEKTLGPEHPLVATSLNSLATVHQSTGAHDEARVLLERALAIREKKLGPKHPNVAAVLNNLANAHAAMGTYGEAEVFLERALAIQEETLGPEHPDVASVLAGLAGVHKATGAYEEAKRLHERALAIQEETLGPEHPDVATILTNLATVHEATGDHGKAKELYERALAIREKALDPEHPHVAYALVGLARVALAEHRPSDAVPLAQRASTSWEKAGVAAEVLAAARWALARALWEAPDDAGRDRTRARALAEQARDAFRAAGPGSARDLAEAEAWLATHPRE